MSLFYLIREFCVQNHSDKSDMKVWEIIYGSRCQFLTSRLIRGRQILLTLFNELSGGGGYGTISFAHPGL